MAETFDCVVQAWLSDDVVISRIFRDANGFFEAMTAMDDYMLAEFPTRKVLAKRAFGTNHIGSKQDDWRIPYGHKAVNSVP